MDLSQVYGGDSLKAGDLQGREVPVVISDVQMKKFDNGNKLVISFQGKKKSLVCNKTNANRIAYLYGTNTDGWIGHEIILFADLVDFQGKTVEAIRIRAPANRGPAPPPPPAAQQRQHAVTQRDGYRLMTTEPVDAIEEATGVRTPNRLVDDDPIPF
jgi:hypothetical protein